MTLAQILVSVILIILILLQERSSTGGLGIFGGSDGGFYQTRRGFEKAIFGLTIVVAFAFAGLALLNLVL
ncbi:MAG: preprotein translocase subunit SecG [bacterium]|nr:preprotein translocase subunit SecG [bacterium]